MAAPLCCCPFGDLLHKLRIETEWTSADIVKLQELHTESDCPHVPLRNIQLTRMRHRKKCTITPLFIAIEQGDLEMVKLIHQTWEVNIHHATLNNTYLVKPPSSTDLLRFKRVTPLFAAAYFKHYDIVRYLIGQKVNISVGASIQLIDEDDKKSLVEVTPLHAAFLLLEQGNVESVQIAIIRFLLESGADPNALSSGTHFLPLMFCISSAYAKYEGREIQYNTWMNPNSIYFLIELGMSVTQKYPSFGTTVVHLLAGSITENVEDFVQLLLQKGADLQARDDHGFTPIMSAAAGNNRVPNITFLNHLLDREDIPNKDKIDALEVAAAILLSYETNADLFDIAFDYLSRARQLRIHESFPLPQQPQSNNRAFEWITSATNEQNIQHHPEQFPMQSFLIRLRIYSAMSWQAVYQYLWPYISLYYFNKLKEEDLHDQLLDISWKMLETIQLFSLQEKGIWIATVKVVPTLAITLDCLRCENNLLYNVDTVKTSLQLVSNTYQVILDHNDDQSVVLHYFFALVHLLSFTAELLPTDIESSVRKIVSPNGRCVRHGVTLFLVACYFELPADNLLAVIKVLLQHGANPHAICNLGQGALHHLAMGKTNRQDIEATARHLLDMNNGLHLDHVDNKRRTAADCYREYHPEANVLPDWLQEGVPKLACLSARVTQGNNIPTTYLPATLQPFVKKH